MRLKYPNHEIVTDIGSGLNYKRKGLQTILDDAMRGAVEEVVVAHKDRLCRFGFELIQRVVENNQGRIVVCNSVVGSPNDELVDDITSILHVFTCRFYGRRQYATGSKKKTGPKTKGVSKLSGTRRSNDESLSLHDAPTAVGEQSNMCGDEDHGTKQGRTMWIHRYKEVLLRASRSEDDGDIETSDQDMECTDQTSRNSTKDLASEMVRGCEKVL
jgi:hypothetical protein